MPNTSSKFNPAYSTVKAIYFSPEYEPDDFSKLFNLIQSNTEARFEKMEIVENITDILPSGCLIVKDFKDFPTFIASNQLKHIYIEFIDGKKWICDITSISYVNNAASKDDTLLSIHFTNLYYRYFSTYSLNLLMGYKKPQVFRINDFVDELKKLCGLCGGSSSTSTSGSCASNFIGYNDPAKNYFVYRPLNPSDKREEIPSDNLLNLLKYSGSLAIDDQKNPNFMVWTSMDGSVNFKSFKRDITKDTSFGSIDADYRNIAVFDAEAITQKLSDNKVYRKAYFFATNPATQWLSKNYFYIRKTPKCLDELPPLQVPSGLSGAALQDALNHAKEVNRKLAIKNLAIHFQDEGQKYNIDVIATTGRTAAPWGADNIMPVGHWGYYDGMMPTNNQSITNLVGNQFGIEDNYKILNLMGLTGAMPYADSPDMWKNMFDMTPIHPHYPDEHYYPDKPDGTPFLKGDETYLQNVMDVRYNVFMGVTNNLLPTAKQSSISRQEQLRQIELQNFIMYSLCCMGKKEDCFFAVLQRYEPDSSYYGLTYGTGSIPTGLSGGPTFANDAMYYRYKWNKINFTSGLTGVTSAYGIYRFPIGSGVSGATYPAHQLENWSLDPFIKSTEKQDGTWAINLNERGLTGFTFGSLPPGWIPSPPTAATGFKFRPIGCTGPANFQKNSGDIFHIARICVNSVDANSTVVYFWAENVLDGSC